MKRICPICQSTKNKKYFGNNIWSIYECRECGNAFTFPFPKMIDYENQDFHNVNQIENKLKYYIDLPYDWKKLIEIQIEFVESYISKKGKILEIGCGEGLLLNELNKMDYNLTGLEASFSACKRGQKKGINIKQGYFEKEEFDENFDCIILSQVLEHVKDLNVFIDKLKKIIPNGYLILTQSNYKGLIPFFQKENWYAWVPEQHFWHFTFKGLKKILEKFGFTYVDSKYSSLVHPHNYTYKLSKLKLNWQDQFTVVFKHNK